MLGADVDFQTIYEMRGSLVGISALEKMHVYAVLLPTLPALSILGFVRVGAAQALVLIMLIVYLGEGLVFQFMSSFGLCCRRCGHDTAELAGNVAAIGSLILHALYTDDAFGTTNYNELCVVMAVMICLLVVTCCIVIGLRRPLLAHTLALSAGTHELKD